MAVLNRDGKYFLNSKQIMHSINGFSISDNGDVIFTAEGEEAGIYNIIGEHIGSFIPRENVSDVDNTPDGTYFVVGSDDMRIYLLEKSQT